MTLERTISVRLVLLVAALLFGGPAPVVAAALPTATPCGGIPAVNDPAPTLEEAFAVPIDDAGLLGLIEQVVRTPKTARDALLDSSLQPPPKSVRTEIDGAVRAGCKAPLVLQAAVRAANELAAAWNDSPGDRIDAFVAKRLIPALAAEATRDAISPATLTVALAPLTVPLPAPAPRSDCAASDGEPVVDGVEPHYPATASRTGAQLQIAVQLDAQGLVRAARLYKATYTAQAGHDELVAESIVAAARSTYTQRKPGCSIRGSFLVRFEFTAHT